MIGCVLYVNSVFGCMVCDDMILILLSNLVVTDRRDEQKSFPNTAVDFGCEYNLL